MAGGTAASLPVPSPPRNSCHTRERDLLFFFSSRTQNKEHQYGERDRHLGGLPHLRQCVLDAALKGEDPEPVLGNVGQLQVRQALPLDGVPAGEKELVDVVRGGGGEQVQVPAQQVHGLLHIELQVHVARRVRGGAHGGGLGSKQEDFS